jgi:hypothetical protein
MSAPLRPLTLGELLDRTFALYRSNFLLFVGTIALPQLLTLAANLWLVLLGGRHAGPVASLLFALETLALALLAMVVLSIAQGAVIIAVSHLHLGRPASIASSYSGLSGRMASLCFATLWVGFLEGLGFLLLIVPGVIMALRWALVIPVMALEDHTISDAMSRSSSLTEGHRGRIFMIFLLYVVMLVALSLAWTVIERLTVGSLTSNVLAPSVQSQIAEHVTSFLTQCLVGPLLTISMALVYYDERVRKEAFDLEHMMADLDTSAPAVTTA